MDTLLRDIRHAVRQLARERAFTLTAITILALGIGANHRDVSGGRDRRRSGRTGPAPPEAAGRTGRAVPGGPAGRRAHTTPHAGRSRCGAHDTARTAEPPGGRPAGRRPGGRGRRPGPRARRAPGPPPPPDPRAPAHPPPRIHRAAPRVLGVLASLRQQARHIRFDRREHVGHVAGVQRRVGVKVHRVAALGEHAVEHEGVQMDVRIQRPAETLHDGHRAAAPVRPPRRARAAAESRGWRAGHAPSPRDTGRDPRPADSAGATADSTPIGVRGRAGASRRPDARRARSSAARSSSDRTPAPCRRTASAVRSRTHTGTAQSRPRASRTAESPGTPARRSRADPRRRAARPPALERSRDARAPPDTERRGPAGGARTSGTARPCRSGCSTRATAQVARRRKRNRKAGRDATRLRPVSAGGWGCMAVAALSHRR